MSSLETGLLGTSDQDKVDEACQAGRSAVALMLLYLMFELGLLAAAVVGSGVPTVIVVAINIMDVAIALVALAHLNVAISNRLCDAKPYYFSCMTLCLVGVAIPVCAKLLLT